MIQSYMNNKEFWFFLFALGVLMFNWPFLDIFNMVLPYYFFAVWGLFIFIICAVVTVNERRNGNRNV